jgi:uncharacterized protein (TIGR02996 family)
MAADKGDGPSPGGKRIRRIAAVMAGELAVGKFALPPLDPAPAAKTRYLLGAPTRGGKNNESLHWIELDAAGKPREMSWTPASAPEARALAAFEQATSRVDWKRLAAADPRFRQPNKPGSKKKAPANRSATPTGSGVAKPRRRTPKEEKPYLQRIAADPANEAAQRAYADWLDQYRDPLAKLIRIRLERARLPASDPQRAALAGREEALLATHAKKWGESLAAFGPLPAALKRLGARIRLDDQGTIHHIDIREDQVNAGALREFAAYPGLRELELNAHPLTREEMEALSRLDLLRELHLHGTQLDDDGFEPLGRLANLERLCLHGQEAKGRGLAHLSRLPRLETLIIGSLPSADGSELRGYLLALESWPALKELFLRNNRLGGEAIAPLGRLRQLESLGLDGNPIRDDDLAHLSGLVKLKWLNLEGTEVTGAGLVHLRKLASLEVLKTEHMPDADAAAPILGELKNLRELALRGPFGNPSLTDAGAARLAPLVHLARLDVRDQALTDAALAHFAGFADLEELNLSDNERIVGPGLEHLKGLSKLKRLELDGTRISDTSIPLLKGFTGLEYLSLFNTRVSERGRAALRKAIPNAYIS